MCMCAIGWIFSKASHRPWGHMISSRPLIGPPPPKKKWFFLDPSPIFLGPLQKKNVEKKIEKKLTLSKKKLLESLKKTGLQKQKNIGLSIRIGRESQCLLYAVCFLKVNNCLCWGQKKMCCFLSLLCFFLIKLIFVHNWCKHRYILWQNNIFAFRKINPIFPNT